MSANAISAGHWTTPHVGRMEGEGPERFWATFNQSSGSTSEQGPGVRTDEFNNIIRAWNEGKAFTMCMYFANLQGECQYLALLIGETLPIQYRDAKKQLVKQQLVHESLTVNLPAADIKKWEDEPIVPTKDAKGNWASPMMDPVFTGEYWAFAY